MRQLIWINGNVSPLDDARVSVEDRGFQFADGVYEVIRVYDGRCFALRPHVDRLQRSAGGIKLSLGVGAEQFCDEIEKLVESSGMTDGMVYVQLTRGVCPRNHLFPSPACTPTLLFYTRRLPHESDGADGIALITVPDLRWKMCWIKSIALLANVLAKNEAAVAGAEEAVFLDDGMVSECSTSNLFIVTHGKLVTHPAGARVLPGITRDYLLECARELDIPVEERPIPEADVIAADEIFISSTTREVDWVTRWNGEVAGGGERGAITAKLHAALQERIRQETHRSGRRRPSASTHHG